MIVIENLTKFFPGPEGPVLALDGVSLRVPKGSIFGVIGMSGAGKSTLLRCLCLLERPSAGTIAIAGEDIHALRGAAEIRRRRKTGVVFQGYNLLLQRSVLENVRFPLDLAGVERGAGNKRALELLATVGLADKAAAYPAQLSGGQKQRVAIARALATDPDVLLCDEPTSALDSLTTKNILHLLRQINESLGVTIVLITHEIGVVRAICHQVAVIDNARIAECGDTAQIFENPASEITKLLLGKEAV